MTNSLDVTCDQCHKTHKLSQYRQGQREVIGYNVQSVGIACPNCGKWTHSYFTNGKLEQKRKKVDEARRQARGSKKAMDKYLRVRQNYSTYHDAFQKRYGELLSDGTN